MPNWGGATKGAARGAAAGSAFGPWGTAIGGIGGGFMGLFSSDEEKEAADAYNEWIKGIYGEGGVNEGILGEMGARGIDPYGPSTNTSQGTSSQMGSQSSVTNTRAREIMRKIAGSPEQAKILKSLESQIGGRLGKPAVSEGEMMRKLAMETKLMDIAERSARDKAGIRGMGPGQAMGGTIGMASDRAGRLLDTLAARPELERKRQFENEQAANQLLNAWQGSDRKSNSRSATNSTSNMFNQFSNQGTNFDPQRTMMGMQKFLAPPSPNSTAGGFSEQDAMDIFSGAAQAYGAYQGRPQQPVQQLPAARNWNNQVWPG